MNKRRRGAACAALLTALLAGLPLFASAASASLTGTTTVRQGDTVTLTYAVSGGNISGAQGELSYDASKLTLTGTKQLIGSPWAVEFNGNVFTAYDNELSSPINGGKSLFSATFTVNAAAGTALSVTVAGAKTSDGAVDSALGGVGWSATVLEPLSGNTNLASLTVANAAISPAFTAGVTSYAASVPYEVSALQVSAAAEDAAAKVSVNSPALTPNGVTNVTITVTAASGAKKTYTIRVTRAQDPNYTLSADNRLASITVNGYVLSPPFSADVARYVVWLPYETESVSVSAAAADGKAAVTVAGGEALTAGADNEIRVICTAENGDGKEYIVVAKRAAADGAVTETITTTAATEPVEETDAADSGGSAWLTVLLCALFAAAGAGAGGMFGLVKFGVLKIKPAATEDEA